MKFKLMINIIIIIIKNITIHLKHNNTLIIRGEYLKNIKEIIIKMIIKIKKILNNLLMIQDSIMIVKSPKLMILF